MKRMICLAVAVCALFAAPASGDVVRDITRECAETGELVNQYSPADLQKALKAIAADASEYTECVPMIRDALRDAATGEAPARRTGNIGIGEEAKLSPAVRQQIDKAIEQAHKPKPVELGLGVVTPGTIRSSATLPTPIIVALVLAGIAGLAGGVGHLVRRLR
jgi:hypothetical protein